MKGIQALQYHLDLYSNSARGPVLSTSHQIPPGRDTLFCSHEPAVCYVPFAHKAIKLFFSFHPNL